MKRYMLHAGVLLLLGAFAVAQEMPSGTHQSPNEKTAVRPTKKKVAVTPETVRAAQERLSEGGYYIGPANGRMNAATANAIRKYQAAENIRVSGKLDEETLSQMNIAAGSTIGAAPGDMGRGAKAAGHDISTGHPMEAGKSMGEGTGRSAKKVGEGTKSGAVEGGETVGEGSKDVAHGAKQGGKSVGHGAKEGAQTVGHGAKEGAEDVGSATKTGAKKVGHGVKTLGKKVVGKDDDDKKTTPPPQ